MRRIVVAVVILIVSMSCISTFSETKTPNDKELMLSAPASYDVNNSFHITIQKVLQSQIAVIGPYVSGLYTVTAEDDMKYIIVIYSLTNNSDSPAYPPIYITGKVKTDKKHMYPSWSPLGGVIATEFSPRHSTIDEIQRYGGKSKIKQLYPEKTIIGSIVFYVPKDENVLSINLPGLESELSVQE